MLIVRVLHQSTGSERGEDPRYLVGLLTASVSRIHCFPVVISSAVTDYRFEKIECPRIRVHQLPVFSEMVLIRW